MTNLTRTLEIHYAILQFLTIIVTQYIVKKIKWMESKKTALNIDQFVGVSW